MWKILLVDDEPKDHALLAMVLPPEYRLVSCFTGQEALSMVGEEKPDLVLLDIRLPDMSGIEVLKALGSQSHRPIYFMLTGYPDTELVVDSIKAGADEYIVKPYRSRDLLRKIRKHLLIRGLQGETTRPVPPGTAAGALVGDSSALREIRSLIATYAASDETVLITGESGTGKEVVAQALHRDSARSRGPFNAVNCGAVPETLFESEMFGSDRGAFTGATNRPGLFESSDGGTLFLDEIGELSPSQQVKILRVLEDKRVTPLGSHRATPVDVRVIAATNRDLRRALETREFRSDLFYRINVLRISIPPLRERREDIPSLCFHFLRELKGPGGGESYLAPASFQKLLRHSWPGNVRELKNVISRARALCEDEKIGPEYIQFD